MIQRKIKDVALLTNSYTHRSVMCEALIRNVERLQSGYVYCRKVAVYWNEAREFSDKGVDSGTGPA